MIMESRLSSVQLSSFGLRREPPRPPEDRTADYERLFDFDTLFYDVFRGRDPRQVICLGPPLLNCKAAFATALFHTSEGKGEVRWEYRPPASYFQPSCRILLTGSRLDMAERLTLEIAGRTIEIPIRPSGHAYFAGRRVITTLSKDNSLDWIQDWATFNARIHGADAVLFYDNGSTAYDMGELRRVLQSVPGMVQMLVVSWNFPYGPGPGPRNIQDSFYCQPGALDHARRRFCAGARGVLNTDIDELVVMASGGSLFAKAEASARAIVFSGYWALAPEPAAAPAGTIRHTDCRYSHRRRVLLRRFCPARWLLRTKWIVLPERCPEDADWGVHDLYPRQAETRRAEASWKRRPRDVFYRHFMQINTGWKTPRWTLARYSPLRFQYDRELARAFSVAFSQRSQRRTKGFLSMGLAWLRERWGASGRSR